MPFFCSRCLKRKITSEHKTIACWSPPRVPHVPWSKVAMWLKACAGWWWSACGYQEGREWITNMVRTQRPHSWFRSGWLVTHFCCFAHSPLGHADKTAHVHKKIWSVIMLQNCHPTFNRKSMEILRMEVFICARVFLDSLFLGINSSHLQKKGHPYIWVYIYIYKPLRNWVDFPIPNPHREIFFTAEVVLTSHLFKVMDTSRWHGQLLVICHQKLPMGKQVVTCLAWRKLGLPNLIYWWRNCVFLCLEDNLTKMIYSDFLKNGWKRVKHIPQVVM